MRSLVVSVCVNLLIKLQHCGTCHTNLYIRKKPNAHAKPCVVRLRLGLRAKAGYFISILLYSIHCSVVCYCNKRRYYCYILHRTFV